MTCTSYRHTGFSKSVRLIFHPYSQSIKVRGNVSDFVQAVEIIPLLQYYASAGEVLLFFDYLLTLPDEVCPTGLRYRH